LSDIPSGSYFEIILPASPTDINITQINPTCSSLFSSVTLTCTFDDASNKITINGMFPVENNDGQYGIKISNVFNGANSLTTSSFELKLLASNGLSIVEDNSGIITTIYEPVATCSSPCNTCAGTPTTCTSCIVPSNEPFFNPQTNTCAKECPIGFFPLGTICYPCYDTCATCYDYAANNCVTCDPGYVFENGFCITAG